MEETGLLQSTGPGSGGTLVFFPGVLYNGKFVAI